MSPGNKEFEKQNAACIVSGTPTILPAANGIVWAPDQGGNWAPRWQDLPSDRKFIAPRADDWPAGSMICASPDGHWQFIWLASEIRSPEGFTAKAPPAIRNTQWISQHPSIGVELSIQVGDAGAIRHSTRRATRRIRNSGRSSSDFHKPSRKPPVPTIASLNSLKMAIGSVSLFQLATSKTALSVDSRRRK